MTEYSDKTRLASYQQDTLLHDDLIAGPRAIEAEKYTLDTGVVTRGAVVGKITATGKVITSVAAAVDGSEAPIGIAVHDADASAGDADLLVYSYGDFNERRLSFGAGHNADTVRAPLRALGIHLVATLPN